ncbi:hypothetical protein Golomagni_06223 [Golovinomyces magnicellulatus]|nr:hypothetical protein Golomagni_06223 [Golovinomyces magnicellulatus]
MSSGNKELFEKGLKNRKEVVGEAYVDKALKNGSSEFAYPNQQLVTEYVIYFCVWLLSFIVYLLTMLDGAGVTCGLERGWIANSAVYSVCLPTTTVACLV